MKPLKLALTILLFLFALSGPAEAQVSDTISITIEGNVTQVLLVGEYVTPFRVGDSVLFRATVIDEAGDPISAMLTYFSEDTTALRLEPLPNGEALGVALKKATVRVWVVAEPITEMFVASFRPPDSLNWSGHDTIACALPDCSDRPTLQFCGYLVRAGYLVAESPGPPLCPIVFVPEPLDPSYVLAYNALSEVDRRISPEEFERLARGVR